MISVPLAFRRSRRTLRLWYHIVMKRFLAFIFLFGIIYAGYLYYRESRVLSIPPASTPPSASQVVITQASNKLGEYASVLGASIQNVLDNGQTLLNQATHGSSEPIINQLISQTQSTLKDLPKQEADKIKYEFCKGVVTNYESSKGTTP